MPLFGFDVEHSRLVPNAEVTLPNGTKIVFSGVNIGLLDATDFLFA